MTMFNKTIFPSMVAAALLLGAAVGGAPALAGGKGGGGSEVILRAALTAPAAAGDISGQADYRDRQGRRQFSVEVEGFGPGEVYDVEVANVVVGTVTIDALGFGDLNFDDNFEAGQDAPATQFPATFPAISANGGEKVEVGPLAGTLQKKK